MRYLITDSVKHARRSCFLDIRVIWVWAEPFLSERQRLHTAASLCVHYVFMLSLAPALTHDRICPDIPSVVLYFILNCTCWALCFISLYYLWRINLIPFWKTGTTESFWNFMHNVVRGIPAIRLFKKCLYCCQSHF